MKMKSSEEHGINDYKALINKNIESSKSNKKEKENKNPFTSNS